MSINIFQFLKQGTTLSRKSLQNNKTLQQKITPRQRSSNQLYFQTGRFTQSDNEELEHQVLKQQGKKLREQRLKHQHNKKIQRSANLRKKYRMKVQGTDVPFMACSFDVIGKRYNINGKLLDGIAEMGLKKPTPVQMQTIPALLQDRNVLVTAPTGTGKTLSYLIPIVQSIYKGMQNQQQGIDTSKQDKKSLKQKKQKVSKKNKKSINIESIIITPQQQLSHQIIHQLNQLTALNKQQSQTQIRYKNLSSLSQQEKQKITNLKSIDCSIVVGTPQLFLNTFGNDLRKLNYLTLVKFIILDECDKYFQQSFLDQIKNLLQMFNTIKSKPTYGLFSATIQHPVQQLLKTQLLDDALRIQVGGKNKVINGVEQTIQYCTNQYGKILQLKNMISQNRFVPPALIFVQQKTRTKQLLYEVKKILKNGPGGLDLSKKVDAISSQKSKQERKQILQKFQKGVILVLITTDLIARGIDFSHVNLVINYDFPNSMLTYIHRVGRTGRAQRTGKAVTFFTEQDKPIVRSLANLLAASGCPVPQWILQLPKINKNLKKKLQKYPIKRLPVGVSQQRDKKFQKQLDKMQKIWKRKKQQTDKQDKQKGQGQNQQDQWIQV